MRTTSAILSVLLLASFAQAQLIWTRAYGGIYDDEGYSVQQTSDGGYIIAGYTESSGSVIEHIYLIKVNASGDTLWTRTYGGTDADFGRSVQQTTDGGYIIAGYTEYFGTGVCDVLLLKTDSLGGTLWARTFGGDSSDGGYSVQQTSDGGYVIAGWAIPLGADSNDVCLVKTNASGDTLWTRTYGGTGDDRGYSVRQTTDGGYVIAGRTESFGAGKSDVYIIRTDASGDTLWTRTYGGAAYDGGQSIQQTSDGGYVIAGWIGSLTAPTQVYLIKTDSLGDSLWTRIYGIDYGWGYSVQQTSDGGYIIVATAPCGTHLQEVYLIKTNSSGDTLWTRTHGGTDYDCGYSVQQTSDGGYIVAGCTNSFGTGDLDVYLIKTDSNGNVGVKEPGTSRQKAVGSLRATPNPFALFARVPGHETERFELYDISGKMKGTYPGNRIGEGLPPAVYSIKLEGKHRGSLRIVKVG